MRLIGEEYNSVCAGALESSTVNTEESLAAIVVDGLAKCAELGPILQGNRSPSRAHGGTTRVLDWRTNGMFL